MTLLQNYPTRTRVAIGDRTFEKVETGSFWREESDVPGNRITRPAVSLEGIEEQCGKAHVVLEPAVERAERERAGG